MKILLLRDRATPPEVSEMLEELGTYIKVAVDVERGIVAGGGEWHADCEQPLLSDGSRQEDIWGADWLPDVKQVRFEALINIRPRQNNRSMTVQDKELRSRIEKSSDSCLKETGRDSCDEAGEVFEPEHSDSAWGSRRRSRADRIIY